MSIEMFIGPMLSGKTTMLVQRVTTALNEGKIVAVIENPKNTRNAERDITQRLQGKKVEIISAFDSSRDAVLLFPLVRCFEEYDLIVIEEFHLYEVFNHTAEIMRFVERARRTGVNLLIAGCHMNGHKNCLPFEIWDALYPFSDTVYFLRSRVPCAYCKTREDVVYSVAMGGELVGEQYKNLCPGCFQKWRGQKNE